MRSSFFQILLTPPLVFPRCVCDVRGHHLHCDAWWYIHPKLRLRLCAGLGGFPSLSHQRPHLYCPEEERMREGAEKKSGGVDRILLITTSHCAYCPQTIDWHPNNTTKARVSLIIVNTKWRHLSLLGISLSFLLYFSIHYVPITCWKIITRVFCLSISPKASIDVSCGDRVSSKCV